MRVKGVLTAIKTLPNAIQTAVSNAVNRVKAVVTSSQTSPGGKRVRVWIRPNCAGLDRSKHVVLLGYKYPILGKNSVICKMTLLSLKWLRESLSHVLPHSNGNWVFQFPTRVPSWGRHSSVIVDGGRWSKIARKSSASPKMLLKPPLPKYTSYFLKKVVESPKSRIWGLGEKEMNHALRTFQNPSNSDTFALIHLPSIFETPKT